MKTKALMAILLSLTLIVCTCSASMPASAEGADPTGITLNETELSLLLGGELAHLTAVVEPAGAADVPITWKSSDWRVARVSEGNVISIGEGTATITALTPNGLSAECTVTVHSDELLVTNDVFALDTDGNPIFAQCGSVYKFGDTFYWYGVNFGGTSSYYNSLKQGKGTTGNTTWSSIRCYSSKNLVDWKFEGDVAKRNSNGWPGTSWMARMGVVYNAKNDNYVMMGQQGSVVGGGGGSAIFFATAPEPAGPWTYLGTQSNLQQLGSFSSNPDGITGGTGDMTAFWDYKTGKAYIVYCCDGVTVPPYTQNAAQTLPERDYLYIAELNDDFTQVVKVTEVYDGKKNNLGREGGHEANCMFTYAGYYYYVASGLRGWNTSATYWMGGSKTATGPFVDVDGLANHMTPMKGSTDDFSHVTQVVGFVTVDTPVTSQAPNGQMVIEYGDRWCDCAGHGRGYDQWAPLTFETGDNEWPTPVYNSMSQFYLDVENGTWEVGPNNNYIKNPAFECDRIAGALGVIQGYVNQPTGWQSETISGQTAQINYGGNRSTSSSERNYQLLDGTRTYNSAFEGNYAWYHGYTKRNEGTDPYKARTKQTITGLENGSYTMYGWVKSSGGQNACDVYANAGGKEYKASLTAPIDDWKLVVVSENIEVTDGKCEIGFYSDAAADQWAMFDDLALIRNQVQPTASVSTDKVIYELDEQITVTVKIPNTVEKVWLASESGVGLASSRSKIDNGDGTATWTLALSLGTVGSRKLSVFADGEDTLAKVKLEIVYPAASGTAEILSVMPPLNIKANEAFTVTFVTNKHTEYVRLFNENGAGLMPSACSYTDSGDTRTWSYTLAVGTAGQRAFTAKAAGSDRAFSGNTMVSLYIG